MFLGPDLDRDSPYGRKCFSNLKEIFPDYFGFKVEGEKDSFLTTDFNLNSLIISVSFFLRFFNLLIYILQN